MTTIVEFIENCGVFLGLDDVGDWEDWGTWEFRGLARRLGDLGVGIF